MTRCEDFYEKWRKYPNWCEKTKGAVSQINSYLKLVDQLSGDGIPEEFSFVNFSAGAALPIVSIKDPVIKDKVLTKVKSSLKAKKSYCETMKKGDPECGGITSEDVKSIIKEVTAVPTGIPKDITPKYYVRFKLSDHLGEDMSDWISISYEDYEALILKYRSGLNSIGA